MLSLRHVLAVNSLSRLLPCMHDFITGKSQASDAWRRDLLHKVARADAAFNPDNAKICSRHFEVECFSISMQTYIIIYHYSRYSSLPQYISISQRQGWNLTLAHSPVASSTFVGRPKVFYQIVLLAIH